MSEKILDYVINEFRDRGLLDETMLEQVFGCQSYDEVKDGIKTILANPLNQQ